ncbi:hypothetical protein Tco_1139468 [Tanacetum coccineum]
MKCPQHYLTDMQEVILFYNGLDVPTRQILDSKGAVPSMTAATAKVAIQQMFDDLKSEPENDHVEINTESSPGLERQQVAAAGALEVAEGAPVVDEGVLAVSAPVQAPQPHPAAAPTRTIAQRLSILEEEVHNLHGDIGDQSGVLENMAHDFSKFTTWTVTSLSGMMDQSGVRYTSYSDFQIPYQRRVRRRIGDASTSAPQQPDP